MFVGALTGPIDLFRASGLRCINLVEFANPLYVPSDSPTVCVFLVEPKRFLDDKASVEFSSYQLLCFVASLEGAIVALRSAVNFVAEKSVAVEAGLFEEEATTAPVFFLRRFILRPDSSSEDEKESLSELAGGGAAALLRKLPLPERFLNIATGVEVEAEAEDASLEAISAILGMNVGSGGMLFERG